MEGTLTRTDSATSTNRVTSPPPPTRTYLSRPGRRLHHACRCVWQSYYYAFYQMPIFYYIYTYIHTRGNEEAGVCGNHITPFIKCLYFTIMYTYIHTRGNEEAGVCGNHHIKPFIKCLYFTIMYTFIHPLYTYIHHICTPIHTPIHTPNAPAYTHLYAPIYPIYKTNLCIQRAGDGRE